MNFIFWNIQIPNLREVWGLVVSFTVQLWEDLTFLENTYVVPWIFVRDSNVVLSAHEKRGLFRPIFLAHNSYLGLDGDCHYLVSFHAFFKVS